MDEPQKDLPSQRAPAGDQLCRSWEAYQQWLRKRSGLRAEVQSARESQGFDLATLADLVHKNIKLHRRGKEKLKVKTIKDYLGKFESGRGKKPLDTGLLEATIDVLGISTAVVARYLGAIPPFDLHRSQWLSDTAACKKRAIEWAGWTVHRLPYAYQSRYIRPYIREWKSSDKGRPKAEARIHSGSGFLHVIEGEIYAEFSFIHKPGFGFRLRQGDSIMYDSSHPHQFVPAKHQTKVEVLDVLFCTHGVASHFEPTLYESEISVGEGEGGRKLDFYKKVHTSIALQGTFGATPPSKAFAMLSGAKLRKFRIGSLAPTCDEINEIAYLLGLRKETFYQVLDEDFAARVYRVISKQEMEEAFDGARKPDKFLRRSHKEQFESGQWGIREFDPLPSLDPSADTAMYVGVFEVDGPDDYRKEPPLFHHEQDPSEDFYFVIDGPLGVSLEASSKTHPNSIHGLLARHDGIWFNSYLGHTFYKGPPVGTGRPARALVFRWQFPSRSVSFRELGTSSTPAEKPESVVSE